MNKIERFLLYFLLGSWIVLALNQSNIVTKLDRQNISKGTIDTVVHINTKIILKNDTFNIYHKYGQHVLSKNEPNFGGTCAYLYFYSGK